MANIILNEQAQAQIQEILIRLPIEELPKVQKLIAILKANIEKPSASTEQPA